MKAIIIFMSILPISLSCLAQTPNFNETFRQKRTQRKYLIQQIAALEVYYNYLKKGYQIADKGLTLIGDIRDNAFQSDKTYVAALSNPSSIIVQSPKLPAIVRFYSSAVANLLKLSNECRQNELYTAQEVSYIQNVYENMRKQCDTTLEELSMVADKDKTEMTDDERIKRLDQIYLVMEDRNAFSQRFCSDVRGVGHHRAKAKHEISQSTKLHGI